MITVKNINYNVEDKRILNNVNINFNKGRITSIIGKNGSGKTSLLKCIASLNKYNGNILYDKVCLLEIERRERAKYIAYLPQEHVIPDITVNALVEHGRFPHIGFGRTLSKIDKEKIEYAIKLTNIRDILYKNVKTLSGGERQRTYLAMIIAQDTEVLILDEPTTFLDINYQIEIFDILKTLRNNGKTIILVIHDLQQAFTYSDDIVLLDKGNVVNSGDKNELVNDPNIREIFNISIEKTNDFNSLYSYVLTSIR